MPDPKICQYRWVFRWTKHKALSNSHKNLFDNNPKAVLDFFKKQLNVKMVVFQKEIGPRGGLEHYQGFFSLKSKRRQNSLIAEIQAFLPDCWVRPCRDPDPASRAAINYCRDLSKRVPNTPVYCFPGLPYDGQDVLEELKKLHPWQEKVSAILEGRAHSRHVYFILDSLFYILYN